MTKVLMKDPVPPLPPPKTAKRSFWRRWTVEFAMTVTLLGLAALGIWKIIEWANHVGH